MVLATNFVNGDIFFATTDTAGRNLNDITTDVNTNSVNALDAVNKLSGTTASTYLDVSED